MKKTSLYRHFDEHGRLLYVGISKNAIRRLNGHMSKSWYAEIANVKIQPCKSRKHALFAEAVAIRDEGPLYNIQKPIPRDPDAPPPEPVLPPDPPQMPIIQRGNRVIAYTVIPDIAGTEDGCVSMVMEDVEGFAVADIGKSERGLSVVLRAAQHEGTRIATDRLDLFAEHGDILAERGVTLMEGEDAAAIVAVMRPIQTTRHIKEFQRELGRRKHKAKREAMRRAQGDLAGKADVQQPALLAADEGRSRRSCQACRQ